MDVLQETRRCKIEQVTRFFHKLIRYVRDFIEICDLDIFGQDKMYKVMMMASIEKQEISSIMKKFNVKLHKIRMLITISINHSHQQYCLS